MLFALKVVENHVEFSMSIRLYSLVLIVVLLPVGIVRHLKFLVPFSALANVLLLVGCVLTIYICCLDLPPISSRALVTDVSRWPLFFSTAIFGMEGIGTVSTNSYTRSTASFSCHLLKILCFSLLHSTSIRIWNELFLWHCCKDNIRVVSLLS